jgi:hypothetical protein
MMGVAGILGGALLSAIHGATVINTIYQDELYYAHISCFFSHLATDLVLDNIFTISAIFLNKSPFKAHFNNLQPFSSYFSEKPPLYSTFQEN